MRPIDLDQLVLLPRDSAVERGLDAGNARVLRLLVYVAGPVVVVATLVALGEGGAGAPWIAALAGFLAVFLLRRTRLHVAGFRGAAAPADDLTLVVARCGASPEEE